MEGACSGGGPARSLNLPNGFDRLIKKLVRPCSQHRQPQWSGAVISITAGHPTMTTPMLTSVRRDLVGEHQAICDSMPCSMRLHRIIHARPPCGQALVSGPGIIGREHQCQATSSCWLPQAVHCAGSTIEANDCAQPRLYDQACASCSTQNRSAGTHTHTQHGSLV